MREKFYELLKQYLVALRECDLWVERVHSATEDVEREEAVRKFQVAEKRYKALRQEIRRYPGIYTLPPLGARNDPFGREGAQRRGGR